MCGKLLTEEMLEAAKIGGLEICDECAEFLLHQLWIIDFI
jgi:hypothetical protein